MDVAHRDARIVRRGELSARLSQDGYGREQSERRFHVGGSSDV